MCTLEQIQDGLCTSGIGEATDPILLLQVIAQLSAELLLVADPGADISYEAIMARACVSGIGRLTDEITLLKIIAQNGCEEVV